MDDANTREGESALFPSMHTRRQHWDSRSQTYIEDVQRAPVRSQALSVLLDLIPVTARRVLDAGTGTGTTALALMHVLPRARIAASDISPGMLKQAMVQECAERVSWVNAHSGSLPFEGSAFDLVTSTFTLHHFPPPEQLSMLRELQRVVVPGGKLLLIDQVLPPDLSPEMMREKVVELFYTHLPLPVRYARLAVFGEWPLTADQLSQRLTDLHMSSRRYDIHPLVSVFDATVEHVHRFRPSARRGEVIT
jgi:SAM-dependent methyltransferase